MYSITIGGKTLGVSDQTTDENLKWLQGELWRIAREFERREEGRVFKKGTLVRKRPWSKNAFRKSDGKVQRADSESVLVYWDELQMRESLYPVDLEIIPG